ncbi:CutA-like periplasmic divalent cation tolerance protein [Encephalitozoon intestinalis ATCC 50506]|uniref:CutA-like periplasmic divalent cation tolerance protein n=1 Tax=Encephalitozoon intestinalis (strain ATCC 50506) TaxID=876142 RepID=E0S6T9_ENCIT|nr:CutA-like periplasmic divalent cation tolerance protein [Encephalitozoon intestinalis ATCC 50506]ADM11424.1 CutA-like periplasmic divalent cation tolerance protein [Encephalitozoon intestinalis ATCC 50506]UTX45117.1 periplasmic divalent cation tolerance protein [Encephalitozoon intestinalis]
MHHPDNIPQRKPFVVFTTYPTRESAEKASYELVNRRLAACCQISKITSVYSWDGSVKRETEYKLAAKTFSSLFVKIQEFMAEDHPYEAPQVVGIEIHSMSEQYLRWMNLNTDAI